MKRTFLFLLLLLPAAADDQPALSGGKSSFNLPSIPAKEIAKANAVHAAAQAPKTAAQVVQGIVIKGGKQAMPIFNTINSAADPSDTPGLAPGQPPVLRWKNGESLSGEIATASPGDFLWKTPLFEDPLDLRWDVVDRIDWPAVPVQPTGPFSIALRDGSFIYGDLVNVGAETISIHSSRHGDAVLKRSEVLSVRRLHDGNLLYDGPTGDVGWKPMANQQDGGVNLNPSAPDFAPPLRAGPGGALRIANWNRSGRMDIDLPDSVDVEFTVSTSERPDFLVALGGNPRATLRIETWDDELVVALGEDFQVIRKIGEGERRLTLRVCWDKVAQKCQIFDAAGALITDWHVPRSIASTAPGLVVENKGLNLSLDYLRVRQWDGKPPPKIDPKQPHVELADGRCVVGDIVPGAPGMIHVLAPGQAAAVDVPMADVDALRFSADQPQVPGREATFLYNDGSILYGRLDSIVDGRASIATSFTATPLSSQLDLLRQIVLNVPPPAGTSPDQSLANRDRIVVAETALHGTLGTSGGASVGWLPVGGVKASRPSLSLPSEITRFFPMDAPDSGDAALFYMTSGDVLPGNLGSLDRTGAEFSSSLMAARKIPAAELNAIKFGPSTHLNVAGFNDPGWQIVRGDGSKIQRGDDGGLRMEPGAAIGFPSLMQCSEISFKFISNGLSAARLKMFTSKAESNRGVNLLLGSTGNQFISGVESTQGQFDNQVQIKTNPGEPVNVRLEVDEDQVELFVNEVSELHIPIDPAKRAGSGLIIEPAGIWGNNGFPVSLAGFSAHSGTGHTWLPDVSDEVRNQVLTVPRSQKDDPPQHLLLAGNGDVLRGEIMAATATHFGFRCGMDDLNVPRDRVGAVIWLKPGDADPAPEPPPEEPAAANNLGQRIPARIMFRQTGLTQLVSFLQGQVPRLKIKLPDTVVPRLVQMRFNNQTVGEALDAICSRFDLHYHQASDGTVVLESASANPTGSLAARTYWLKPGAVPKTPTMQEILIAKGITFGPGCSVQWQPEAGLLSMSNTPDNQARLAALINSDFGGSLGSPNYWLQLASGARLALTVDQIAPDFITGHHPTYGAVKVPMSQVYVIRTTPPPPSAAIRSLDNWRLVNAPEPAIPEGGGEASPLLGKDAASFKLPLLAGGDFNLDDEKGHVVVLDFWATWCGPCVKSLPGLIDAVAAFPADRVKLIGVNQGEAAAQITRFLQTRGLKLAVALDADQTVGLKYGADSIPLTVIVGPDGKVAWVQTGYSEDEDTSVSDVVKKLLGAASAANSSPNKSTQ